jgi:hypothetical protein
MHCELLTLVLIDPAVLAVLPELVVVEVGAQICDDAVG